MLLASINIYQVLVSILSLFVIFKSFVDSTSKGATLESTLMALIGLTITIYILYSNLFLLLKKGNKNKFIKMNIWINLLQVFYLIILGFRYYFVMGFQFLIILTIQGATETGKYFDLFGAGGAIQYAPSKEIILGINIVPFIICLLLNSILKKLNHNFAGQ